MADQAAIDRITALIELSDVELCERHPDATELPAPEECAIAVWSETHGRWMACTHEARWLLDNERYNMPPIKGCPTGVATYLRMRLFLDRLAARREMS